MVFGPNRTSRLGAEYDVEIFEPELDLRANLTLRAATWPCGVAGEIVFWWERQWLNLIRLLTRKIEEFTAGDEHMQMRTGGQQRIHQLRAGVKHMFAIVEHEEQVTSA